MKAIFMTEVGGRFMEIERLVIRPTLMYKRAIRKPIQMIVDENNIPHHALKTEVEVWKAVSRPVNEDGFAIFILDYLE